MILTKEQREAYLNGEANSAVPLAAVKTGLWPRKIPYTIDDKLGKLKEVIQCDANHISIQFMWVIRSGQVRSGQVRSGQVRSGQVRSGQVRAGQVRAGQVRSGQVRSGQVRSGQVRSKAATGRGGMVSTFPHRLLSEASLLHSTIDLPAYFWMFLRQLALAYSRPLDPSAIRDIEGC